MGTEASVTEKSLCSLCSDLVLCCVGSLLYTNLSLLCLFFLGQACDLVSLCPFGTRRTSHPGSLYRLESCEMYLQVVSHLSPLL